MAVPHTYRSRLVVYTTLLLVFLTGVLVLAYTSSRGVILREADKNMERLVQQIEGQLRHDAHELTERAHMIRNNIQIQEYLFVVVTLDTDPVAVEELYERQFGWLPVDRAVLISKHDKPLLGTKHTGLIELLRQRRVLREREEQRFYHYDEDGLALTVATPVHYRGQFLGVVSISKGIGPEWMEATRETSQGHVLMVKDGKVVLSTLETGTSTNAFRPQAGRQYLAGEAFHVQQIQLGANAGRLPTLWFARSEQAMTSALMEQLGLVFGLGAAGCVAILVVGLMMLRNFSAPLGRLVDAIREVSEGRLPSFSETDARDEIGYLSNQIASMVASLRDKQNEINRIHSQLEEQATTDALTGLYNRRHLFDLFPKLLSKAHRQNTDLVAILADLDQFKWVNDHYGHLTGDQCLVHFAAILRQCVRISDFVFRIGGEEFLIISTGTLEGGEILAEKIRAALEAVPLRYDGEVIPMTVSLGVTHSDGTDRARVLEAMLTQADNALYAAKRGGRNRVAAWDASLKRA